MTEQYVPLDVQVEECVQIWAVGMHSPQVAKSCQENKQFMEKMIQQKLFAERMESRLSQATRDKLPASYAQVDELSKKWKNLRVFSAAEITALVKTIELLYQPDCTETAPKE